jgi:hypothetical protein
MTSQTLTSTQERRSSAPYADLGFIRRFGCKTFFLGGGGLGGIGGGGQGLRGAAGAGIEGSLRARGWVTGTWGSSGGRGVWAGRLGGEGRYENGVRKGGKHNRCMFTPPTCLDQRFLSSLACQTRTCEKYAHALRGTKLTVPGSEHGNGCSRLHPLDMKTFF